MEGGGGRLYAGAARGEPPARGGVVVDLGRGERAGAGRPSPAAVLGVAAGDHGAVTAVTLTPAPGAEVHGEGGIAAPHLDLGAHGHAAQRALDEQVPALVQAERAEVDGDHRVSSAAVWSMKVRTAAEPWYGRSSDAASWAKPSVRPGFHCLSPSRSSSGRTTGSS